MHGRPRARGIEAGSRSDAWIHCVDLFSAILELAGPDVPKTVPNRTGGGTFAVDSISLAPIIFKGAKSLYGLFFMRPTGKISGGFRRSAASRSLSGTQPRISDRMLLWKL